MTNDDISYIFNHGLVFDTPKPLVSSDDIQLVSLMLIVSDAAKAKKMPLALSYPEIEMSRKLKIVFEQPFTFERLFYQLAAALDWVLMSTVERGVVYVSLMPRASTAFAEQSTIYRKSDVSSIETLKQAQETDSLEEFLAERRRRGYYNFGLDENRP